MGGGRRAAGGGRRAAGGGRRAAGGGRTETAWKSKFHSESVGLAFLFGAPQRGGRRGSSPIAHRSSSIVHRPPPVARRPSPVALAWHPPVLRGIVRYAVPYVHEVQPRACRR